MSAEAETHQTNDNLPQQLSDDLECNVCFNVPDVTPIYQCKNGHLLCNECHNKLTRCPCCKEQLSGIRSLLAEKLLEKIPVGCKFKKHGCGVILPRVDLQTHGKECKYREVVCPEFCKEMVCLDQLAEHYEKYHVPFPTEVFRALGQNFHDSLKCRIKLFGSVHWSSRRHFNGVYFFLQVKRINCPTKSGIWYIWMNASLTSEECQNFVCDLNISREKAKMSMTNGPVVSLDVGNPQVTRFDE